MVKQKRIERLWLLQVVYGRDRDLNKQPLNKEEVKRFTKEKRFKYCLDER